uniref:Uncharacterized protein n=1 Tax=Romanomermis culicivorax TaxID=13658 RepID=A0A915JWP2_ROMCU
MNAATVSDDLKLILKINEESTTLRWGFVHALLLEIRRRKGSSIRMVEKIERVKFIPKSQRSFEDQQR